MTRYARLVRTIVLASLAAFAGPIHAEVVKKALDKQLPLERMLVADPGFEEHGPAPTGPWEFWQGGYEIEKSERHSGSQSVKCSLAPGDETEKGAAQSIVLNQDRPRPIFASGWSKAVGVSGAPDSGYSLYIDIEYQDGTPLWGQTADFNTGTHDWQHVTCLILPEKPVKSLNLYAIFRRHSGTAYFDDFTLGEVKSGHEIGLFDMVPVGTATAPAEIGRAERLSTSDGLCILLGKENGLVALKDGPVSASSGFLVRDVVASSDFHRVEGKFTGEGSTRRFEGRVPVLGLAVEATFTARKNHIRVDGKVRDLKGEDRAISLYFVLPFNAAGGVWHQDMRRSTKIDTRRSSAGANGLYSPYPLACAAPAKSGGRALCLAAPLDVPRLWRFAFDGAAMEYYVAFDFALSPATAKFPSSATFSFLLYNCDPEWGFRSALRKYYSIFPGLFVKRVPREGLWMAFTDISTVERPEDFHFVFHEGNNNVVWDDQHDILSFVYTEPMTHWMRMPKDRPRTYEAAMAQLEEETASKKQSALITRLCAARQADGRYDLSIRDTPWCDGAVFTLNADPDIAPAEGSPLNQAQGEYRKIERAFEAVQRSPILSWAPYGDGFERDTAVFRSGSQSAKMSNKTVGEKRGLFQTVAVGQKQARPIVVRGWSKAENVTGERDSGYSIYLDLRYDDGTHLWGQTAQFNCGTHDWEQAEYVIRPEKPVLSATVHILFRHTHTGTVWFDDLFVGEEGSDKNLLKNPGMEVLQVTKAELDGTYIDSLEGWGLQPNYNRRHFAFVDAPLLYDLHTRQPLILTIFSTYEFARELERRMRSRGKLMMANAVLHNFCWFAHLLDVMGTETNWHRNKTWRPMTDPQFCFKRAMCYQKPYCFLMNTHYPDFTPDLVERYMKRSLFYGFFPGMFSENAATNCYFENPKWYNRDRALFKKYVPLIQSITKAGWQPITFARTDDPKVYVERFGEPGRGGVFLTIFNDSPETRRFRLELEADPLGITQLKEAADLVSGKTIAFETEAGKLSASLELDPEDVLLIELVKR